MTRISRRALLGGVSASVLVGACAPSWKRAGLAALSRGALALWDLQGADGAFRGQVHGVLKEGWSLTPYALLSVYRAGLPLDPARTGPAFAYLASGTQGGLLGLAAAVPDSPCRATAMALEAVVRLKPSGWQGLSMGLGSGLRGLQLTRALGWVDHPVQGGFRTGSGPTPTPPHAGHVDLSTTRVAVEALRVAGARSSDLAIVEATDFARRCRTGVGGFVHSAADPLLSGKPSRELEEDESATADGILLLDAALRMYEIRRSVDLLSAQHSLEQGPGVAPSARPGFTGALRFYYRRVVARVFHRRGGPEGWQRNMVDALTREQGPNGLWRNPEGAKWEDEPIVATGAALVALAGALSSARSLL